MGKPVNPGQALQLLSVLALNTDWSQLNADDLQRRFVDKPKEAGVAFGAWLKNSTTTLVQAATAVFTFAVGDKRSAKELLAAGNYDWVGDYARQFVEGKKFRLEGKAEEVDIVLVEFDHNPTSEEVLAEFGKQGLERPM